MFSPADDGIDPSRVPTHRLSTGATIPSIGLGTFGSDRFSGEQIAQAVLGAAEVGYRHFDCAAVYANEHLIGPALRTILDGGIRREDMWVTSKLWNDKHTEDDVIPACRKSLSDLGLDYLTSTWSTGRSRTTTGRAAMSTSVIRMRARTSTRAT
jgi:diketogulonate reductase-like aldo/keto reductase